MIILAAAIILSLSNSGIISKANKAKTDSDNANLKEYVNTLRAEWELMTDAERTESGSATFEDYANKKLADNGYKGAVGADGEVYSNLNENARKVVAAGIKVGDTVTGYTVEERTYTTSGEENTWSTTTNKETDPQPNTVKSNINFKWKYMGISANGEVEIIADFRDNTGDYDYDTEIGLGGQGGYLKGPDTLNTVCKELYSKDGVGTARSMNIDDVNNLLEYTGPKGTYMDADGNTIATATPLTIGEIENILGTTFADRTPDGKNISTYKNDYYVINKGNKKVITSDDVRKDLVYQKGYFIASTCTGTFFNANLIEFMIRRIDGNSVYTWTFYASDDGSAGNWCPLRPVVSLNPNVQLSYDSESGVLTIN